MPSILDALFPRVNPPAPVDPEPAAAIPQALAPDSDEPVDIDPEHWAAPADDYPPTTRPSDTIVTATNVASASTRLMVGGDPRRRSVAIRVHSHSSGSLFIGPDASAVAASMFEIEPGASLVIETRADIYEVAELGATVTYSVLTEAWHDTSAENEVQRMAAAIVNALRSARRRLL